MQQFLYDEEGEWFVSKTMALVETIRTMPLTYETEEIDTPDKVLHLHYFGGEVDAWIVERDIGDGDDRYAKGEGPQLQAFGKITAMGGGWDASEWGYISIDELIEWGVELDLHWTPCKVAAMR